MSDFQKALDRLGDSGGEAWKPQKSGEKIALTVMRVERRTMNTDNGPASPIVVTGTDENGTLRDVWCWHTVLHNEMVRTAPQPGDVIAVEYKGKMKPKGGGNGYHAYKVVRADDVAGGTFNWDSAGPSGFVPDPLEPVSVAAQPTDEPEEDDIPF